MTTPTSNTPEIPVRVAGALTGCVYVRTSKLLEADGPSSWSNATVGDLRREIRRLLGQHDSNANPTLLVSGKRLMDDSKALGECGLGPSSKILVMRGRANSTSGTPTGSQVAACPSDEPESDLERIRKSAEAMATRYAGGRGGRSGHLLSLENQNGDTIKLGTPEDSKAIVMSLTLHQKGQASMRKGHFDLASQELLLAEEAMNMVDLDRLEVNIDNKALLLIDLVWCWLKLQDRSYLAIAAKRLQEARQILSKSHGENLERMRVLHGDFCPELATYVRLELLEGVGLFYQGETAAALHKLQSAQAKLERLNVSDEALKDLTKMGFTSSEASRALRFCSGDVTRAAGCVMKLRAARKEAEKRDQDFHRKRREMLRYGKTSSGQHVDMDQLEFLVSMGNEREIAAEALRQTDNNQCAALDILHNELAFTQLQIALSDRNERQMGRRTNGKRPKQPAKSEHVAALMSMGFSADASAAALHACQGNVDRAAETLLANGIYTSQLPAENDPADTEQKRKLEQIEGSPSLESLHECQAMPEEEEMDTENEEESDDEDADLDMEGILADQVRSDPMDAYDVDVAEEGLAIAKYLAMIRSIEITASSKEATRA